MEFATIDNLRKWKSGSIDWTKQKVKEIKNGSSCGCWLKMNEEKFRWIKCNCNGFIASKCKVCNSYSIGTPLAIDVKPNELNHISATLKFNGRWLFSSRSARATRCNSYITSLLPYFRWLFDSRSFSFVRRLCLCFSFSLIYFFIFTFASFVF